LMLMVLMPLHLESRPGPRGVPSNQVINMPPRGRFEEGAPRSSILNNFKEILQRASDAVARKTDQVPKYFRQ
jgi:hypothetical protein